MKLHRNAAVRTVECENAVLTSKYRHLTWIASGCSLVSFGWAKLCRPRRRSSADVELIAEVYGRVP